jgi:hypothetical protein
MIAYLRNFGDAELWGRCGASELLKLHRISRFFLELPGLRSILLDFCLNHAGRVRTSNGVSAGDCPAAGDGLGVLFLSMLSMS